MIKNRREQKTQHNQSPASMPFISANVLLLPGKYNRETGPCVSRPIIVKTFILSRAHRLKIELQNIIPHNCTSCLILKNKQTKTHYCFGTSLTYTSTTFRSTFFLIVIEGYCSLSGVRSLWYTFILEYISVRTQ